MEPTEYTHAGQTIMSSWNQYLEKKDEASLQIVIDTIKELKASFTPNDLPLFQNIRTTITMRNLGLTELDKTVAEIAARLQPQGSIDQVPRELMPLLLPYGMSKKDFQSMSFVSRHWSELSREPARLAQMINHPQFELPLDVLLQFLSWCGPQVHTLDFYRLLSESDRDPSQLTPEKLQKVLSLCPKAQSVYFHFVESLSEKILLDHFTSIPACTAIREIGILGFQPSGRDSGWLVEADTNLPTSCPNLTKVTVALVRSFASKPSLDVCPPGLRNWLKNGNDFFTFMELNGRLFKTAVEQVLNNPLLSDEYRAECKAIQAARNIPLMLVHFLQPDWLFKVTPEYFTQEKFRLIERTLISLTPYEVTQGAFAPSLRNPLDINPLMIVLEQFFNLPHADQNRLLDSNDDQRKFIIEAIRAGKSWQEIVASLP